MGKKAGKKRGRKPKHWVERAKMIYWLQDVLSRDAPTFAYLNIEFSWKVQPVRLPRGRPRAQSDKKLLGANDKLPCERPRTFELIRDEQREPVSTNKKFGMHEMVANMDRHPRFHGTKDIYESDLWRLLKEREVPVERNVQVIDALFDKYGIVKCSIEKIYAPDPKGREVYPLFEPYWRYLAESMQSMQTVDCLTCYWHMHLRQLHDQMEPYKVRGRLEPRLERFFETNLWKLGAEAVEQAHEALMVSKLSFADEGQKKHFTDLWADRTPYIAKDRIGKVEGKMRRSALSMLLDPGW